MKKIFAVLLVLALALVLLPAPTARAEEYTDYEARDPSWPSSIVPGEGSPIPVAIFGFSAESHDWVHITIAELQVTSVGADTATCTSAGEIVCTATGVYEGHTLSVSHTYETPALGHDLVHHDARPATCTEVGWETEGDACSRCSDLNDGMIPALGHSWDTGWTSDGGDTHWHKCLNPGCLERDGEENHTSETVPAVPATCDEGGLSEYTRCSKCEMLLSDQEEYMPLGHQLTPVAKVEATCTTPGTEAYWKCTRDGCGKLFSDADGKNETSLEALTIPALGHDWATELTRGETTHYYACSRCDERKDEAAHTGGTATCKAKAKCTVCGAEYGDFAEHVYPANVWWGDENEHWHRCNVCDQPSAHEAHSGGTPTCTEQAKCDACGNLYGEPLGHEITFVDMVYPTCTEEGMREHYECTRCDKLFSDAEGKNEITAPAVIEALGHQLSYVAKVEPTCTTPGAEAYWKCTRCDKLFSEAECYNEITAPVAIEALGHLPDLVWKVEPTCTEEGMRVHYECTRCDKLFIDVDCHNEITASAAIPALGHDYRVVGRDGGIVTYECKRCKDRYTKKIANTSEPLDDLVQDQAGQAVPYRMEAVDTPAGKAVVVTPDVDQSGQMSNQNAQPTLCLTEEVVGKWLEEGFKFTWFVNGEATLEIDLGKLDFERLFPNLRDEDTHQKAIFLISMWSKSSGLGVLVNALTASMEKVSVTGLAGLTLRIGDTIVDVTLDAEGKFTYTLVS